MYTGGFGAVDTTTLEAEWQRLRNILHGLAVSIATERERGNVAGVQAMLPYFKDTVAKMTDINRQLYKSESELTGFEQFVVDTGDWIQSSVQAVPGAISALPTAIGAGLIKAAIPFAVLYIGYRYLLSPRRKF